jgi:putative addiction module component (TIGR02574 family)
MTLRDQIARQILALPLDDRVYLAELLNQSLNAETFAAPVLAAEWAAEVNRRINAYDRGETYADDAGTAIAKMHLEFAERRAKDS